MARSSTSWAPGQSGNPRGRPPKGTTITEVLRRRLDHEAFVKELLSLVFDKSIDPGTRLSAIKLVLQYVDRYPARMAPLDGQTDEPPVIFVLPHDGRGPLPDGAHVVYDDREPYVDDS